jgi:hypothetical protein
MLSHWKVREYLKNYKQMLKDTGLTTLQELPLVKFGEIQVEKLITKYQLLID